MTAVTQRFDPENGHEGPSRRQLLLISLMSGAVYVGLSWLIYQFFYDRSITTMFREGGPAAVQFSYGALFGVGATLVIGGLFLRTRLSQILSDYEIVRYLTRLPLRLLDMGQLSLVAGVTEEILFRGTIQPLLGIWLTSLLFVGLHGYFKWNSWRHILFGTLMFGLSVGLGYLYRDHGIFAAMTGHAVYDFSMLLAVNYTDAGRYGANAV